MTRKWQKISSKVAYQTPYYVVEEDQVIRPDGKPGVYSVVRGHPFCCVIAINDKGLIYLIKLFRYPTNRYGWELPMGGSDGEDLLVAAKRELKEETGLTAKKWRQIGQFDAANGFSDYVGVTFVAEGLSQSDQHDQEEEGILEAKPVSYRVIKKMVKDGEITDGSTIAALYLAELRGILK